MISHHCILLNAKGIAQMAGSRRFGDANVLAGSSRSRETEEEKTWRRGTERLAIGRRTEGEGSFLKVPEESITAAMWVPQFHDMGLIGGFMTTVYARIHTVACSPMHFLSRPIVVSLVEMAELFPRGREPPLQCGL